MNLVFVDSVLLLTNAARLLRPRRVCMGLC